MSTRSQFRRWVFVALYAVALVALTTAPLSKPHPKRPYMQDFARSPRWLTIDAALNIAMFVPLGWGLYRGLRQAGLTRAGAIVSTGLAGAAFSLSLETVQHFLTWRYSSILDAAGNALGATIGAAANEYWS